MDARAEALAASEANANSTVKKTYTDADYKLREAVVNFVFDSDLVTQRAIREFRKRSSVAPTTLSERSLIWERR